MLSCHAHNRHSQNNGYRHYKADTKRNNTYHAIYRGVLLLNRDSISPDAVRIGKWLRDSILQPHAKRLGRDRPRDKRKRQVYRDAKRGLRTHLGNDSHSQQFCQRHYNHVVQLYLRAHNKLWKRSLDRVPMQNRPAHFPPVVIRRDYPKSIQQTVSAVIL